MTTGELIAALRELANVSPESGTVAGLADEAADRLEGFIAPSPRWKGTENDPERVLDQRHNRGSKIVQGGVRARLSDRD